MRVLLDECVPRRLRLGLSGIAVSTVVDEGWAGLRNGELLRVMASVGFTHLVTVDRNLRFQQHVAAAGVAVVVLRAPSNRLVALEPLLPELLEQLPTVSPGELRVVSSQD